jgi:hypothetical protein
VDVFNGSCVDLVLSWKDVGWSLGGSWVDLGWIVGGSWVSVGWIYSGS